MSQLLTDWCDFCEGQKDFDKSHFYTLFHEQWHTTDLNNIFKYFPESDDLLFRLANVKHVLTNGFEKDSLNTDEIIQLAMADVRNKRKACAEFAEDELIQIIDNLKPRLINDKTVFENAKISDWPQGEFILVLADFISGRKKATEDKYYAIFEAFYGLTTNYQLQWYLVSPLIDSDIQPDNYYQLWRAGADYALTEYELLVWQ